MPIFKGCIVVQLDLGDVKDPFDNKSECFVIGENGKRLEFNSESDFLNWMSQRGWSLEQFKWNTDSHVYFLSKQCTDEKVHEGIKLEYESKKSKKKKKINNKGMSNLGIPLLF